MPRCSWEHTSRHVEPAPHMRAAHTAGARSQAHATPRAPGRACPAARVRSAQVACSTDVYPLLVLEAGCPETEEWAALVFPEAFFLPVSSCGRALFVSVPCPLPLVGTPVTLDQAHPVTPPSLYGLLRGPGLPVQLHGDHASTCGFRALTWIQMPAVFKDAQLLSPSHTSTHPHVLAHPLWALVMRHLTHQGCWHWSELVLDTWASDHALEPWTPPALPLHLMPDPVCCPGSPMCSGHPFVGQG